MDDRPAALRVLNFYRHHPRYLKNNWTSLRLAYVANTFLPQAALALALTALLTLLRRLPIHGGGRAAALCVTVAALGYGGWAWQVAMRDPGAGMAYDDFWLGVYIAAAVLTPIAWRRLDLTVAPVMIMVLLNFFTITLMSGTVDTDYYRSRFIKVADPVHALLAAYLIWEMIRSLRALYSPPLESARPQETPA
jgi:hypothetical protein